MAVRRWRCRAFSSGVFVGALRLGGVVVLLYTGRPTSPLFCWSCTPLLSLQAPQLTLAEKQQLKDAMLQVMARGTREVTQEAQFIKIKVLSSCSKLLHMVALMKAVLSLKLWMAVIN